MEADKGTNLFFAIYKDNNGIRCYESIPFIEVMERQKQGLGPVPEIKANGARLLFYLSPNDLVYVPLIEDDPVSKHPLLGQVNQVSFANQVYKMVSSSGAQCFFIKQNVSVPIWNKKEFSAANKTERSLEGIMIKEVCLKLTVNRIGEVIDIKGI